MDVKHCIRVLVFAGTLCVAFASFSETNAVPVVTEIQTFRLHYVSAAEIAEQINRLMSREVGPDGKLLPVAVANAEANMLRDGVGIKSAQVGAGVMYRLERQGGGLLIESSGCRADGLLM